MTEKTLKFWEMILRKFTISIFCIKTSWSTASLWRTPLASAQSFRKLQQTQARVYRGSILSQKEFKYSLNSQPARNDIVSQGRLYRERTCLIYFDSNNEFLREVFSSFLEKDGLPTSVLNLYEEEWFPKMGIWDHWRQRIWATSANTDGKISFPSLTS